MPTAHRCDDLITLFNRCFENNYRTRLIGGGEEPIYYPQTDPHAYHTIVFTRDYFSSALHECAHWFIAGEARRQCVDYGYWYEPDGRDAKTQRLFEQVEVKPQALEWILSVAADYRFHISLDNLQGAARSTAPFRKALLTQIAAYKKFGLPPRARIFHRALCDFYNTSPQIIPDFFFSEAIHG